MKLSTVFILALVLSILFVGAIEYDSEQHCLNQDNVTVHECLKANNME